MAKILKLLLPLAFSALLAGAAGAEDEVGETRAIDARVVNIRLDGQLDLKVKQGATPSLTVYAERRRLPNILTEQSGDTLRIDTEVSGFHFNKPQLRAELTLPALREVVLAGAGSAVVAGFSGDALRLVLEGAGNLDIKGRYKVIDARLSGVGKLNLNAEQSEQLELALPGVGRVTLVGNSKLLQARLNGVGTLDARQLIAETAILKLNGVGNATLFVSQEVTLSMNGIGSATVHGNPARRNVSLNGLGKIVWE